MTSYRRQTVREIRKLRFPEQLAEIERRRYRHPDCLAAFLDVCDEIVFQDPSLAMLVTREAPPYVDRVFAADGGGPFRIRAFAVLGSAYLAAGRLEEAEAAFAEAEAAMAGSPPGR